MINLNAVSDAIASKMRGTSKKASLKPALKTAMNHADSTPQTHSDAGQDRSAPNSMPNMITSFGFAPIPQQSAPAAGGAGPSWSVSEDTKESPEPAVMKPNTSGYESSYSLNTFNPLENPDRGTAWWSEGDTESPELDEPNQLAPEVHTLSPFTDWMLNSRAGRWGENAVQRYDLSGENTVNERYFAMAREHGVSDEDIRSWVDGSAAFPETHYGTLADSVNPYWDGGNFGAPDPSFQTAAMRTEVDDGTSWDYAHMTSPYMTGRQYRYYVNQGMGGLPPEQIDDYQLYNKQDEMIDHGFQPFTPNAFVATDDLGQIISETPYRAGQHIVHAREALGFGYKINKDGIQVDGRTFDREAGAYMSQVNLADCTTPPARDDVPYSTLVREWALPGSDDGYHYGDWYGDPDSRTIVWEDGTTAHLDPVQWTQVFGGPGYEGEGLSYRLVDSNDAQHDLDPSVFSEGEVYYVPDFVMSDGTRLNYAQTSSIYFDRDSDDTSDGIEYESSLIQPLPQRLTSGEPFVNAGEEREGQDVSDIPILTDLTGLRANRDWKPLENIADWTLGSVPIMLGWPSVGYSLSSASPARYGFDTSSYSPTGHTYRYLSGGFDENGNMVFGGYVPNTDPETREEQPYVLDPRYTEELRGMNMLGNAAIPLTESIAGNVGPDLIRGRWSGAAMAPPGATAGQAAMHHLRGTLAEGAEEIVGNPFEELTRYGISRFYAEPMRDANGNIIYDPMGHEVRYTDTPWQSRLSNFLNSADIANAALGGIGVSLALGGGRGALDTVSRIGSSGPALNPEVSYEGQEAPEDHIAQPETAEPEAAAPQQQSDFDIDAWERYLRGKYEQQ